MAAVTLRSVEKRYPNDTFAVKGVSFEASDGEFVVLVGPSGCGKSTTLRMIAGLEEITGGEIVIGDRMVNDLEPKDRDVAMVFQNYALYPHMTVFDNMAFPLRMRRVDRDTIKAQVEDAARLLSIEHLLARKPKELSGGERQRVAVGRAIVRKPAVFLFDEPLSNLDAALRTQMRAELKRLQRRLGATMLYVTHDQIEAMTMGDKIAVLNKGLLEQFGSPAQIYERPETTFVARFLGTPPMNLIDGTLTHIDGKTRFKANSLTIDIPQLNSGVLNGKGFAVTEAALGVRPEKIRLDSRASNGGLTGRHLTGSQREKDGPEFVGAFVEGKLVLIEPIGSVTHYYLEYPDAAGGTLVASGYHAVENSAVDGTEPNGDRADAYPTNLKLGDSMRFGISTNDIHLFDKSTGRRIDF